MAGKPFEDKKVQLLKKITEHNTDRPYNTNLGDFAFGWPRLWQIIPNIMVTSYHDNVQGQPTHSAQTNCGCIHSMADLNADQSFLIVKSWPKYSLQAASGWPKLLASLRLTLLLLEPDHTPQSQHLYNLQPFMNLDKQLLLTPLLIILLQLLLTYYVNIHLISKFSRCIVLLFHSHLYLSKVW